MLTSEQISFFEAEGYLVVNDVFGPAEIESEYAALLDKLYDGWLEEGLVPR